METIHYKPLVTTGANVTCTHDKAEVTCPNCLEEMKEEDMPAKTFYLVMIDKTVTAAKKRHENFADAQIEAERLLSLPENAGNGAYMLKAIGYGKLQASPVSWKTLD